MRGINKVILLGNVGREPELRQTRDGRSIATFSLATNRSYLNKSGEREEETEWHRVVSFGRLADVCGQYLEKGRPVYLEGKIHTHQWADKEGNSRNTTEILLDTLQLLNKGSRREQGQQPPSPIMSEAVMETPF